MVINLSAQAKQFGKFNFLRLFSNPKILLPEIF